MTDISPDRSSSRAELDLVQFWRALCRRRLWVALCLLVGVAAGAAYAFLKAPVYESRVQVQIGQVAGAGLLEPAEVVAARLLTRYGERLPDGSARSSPVLVRAVAQRGIPGMVDLTVQADSPADAANFLKRIAEELSRAHADLYGANVRASRERLESLESLRASLIGDYEEAGRLFAEVRLRDPLQASLLTMERGRMSTLLGEIDSERSSLAQSMAPPQTRATALIGEIVAPALPARPRKALVLALSVGFGLLAGMMLALALEFAEHARRQAD